MLRSVALPLTLILNSTVYVFCYKSSACTCKQAKTSDDGITLLRKQYQFWGPEKAARSVANFDQTFIDRIYKPLDEFEKPLLEIHILRGLGMPKESYRNQTNVFCDRVATVLVPKTIQIGFASLVYGFKYTDSMVVHNFAFFNTYHITDFHIVFLIVRQKNTRAIDYNLRVLLLVLTPIGVLIASVHLVGLIQMLKKNGSSAITLQFAVQVTDVFVAFTMPWIALPLSLYVYQGEMCKEMNADFIRFGSTLGSVEIFMRLEETVSFIKFILLTMLVTDRALAIATPVFYKRLASVKFALKLVFVGASVGALLTMFTFLNYWYLHKTVPRYFTLALVVVTRMLYVLALSILALMQVLMPILTFSKLYRQWRKHKHATGQKTIDLSRYWFLLFFSLYNIIASPSTIWFVVFDAFLNLMLLEACNRCAVPFWGMAESINFQEIDCAVLQPAGGLVGIWIHIMFLPKYRYDMVRFLHLKQVWYNLRSVCCCSSFNKCHTIRSDANNGGAAGRDGAVALCKRDRRQSATCITTVTGRTNQASKSRVTATATTTTFALDQRSDAGIVLHRFSDEHNNRNTVPVG